MKHIETPKTFTLGTAITTGKDEREITEFTLREPTAGDVEQLQKDTDKDGAAGAVVKLIARQTKLPPTDVRALGARDFMKMQEYLLSFLSLADQPSES